MAPDLLRRIAAPVREFGWAAGMLYSIDRVLRRVSPRLGLYVYEFMVQPIGNKPLLPASLSKNLSFQEIGRGHADIALMPAREAIKDQRFDQGARCIGAYRKGQLIGYLWYCTDRYIEDEVRCTYELTDSEQSVFDFDLYVLPEHRMGVAFLGVWHGVNEMLAPRGVRHTFSRMTRFNSASRRAHARLGSKRVGRGVFLQAWGLEVMVATLAPFLGFTFGVGQRITLRLRPNLLAASRAQAAGHSAG